MTRTSHRDGRTWPGYILGGRLRTSTLALIIAFGAIWWLYEAAETTPSAPPQVPASEVVPPGFIPDPSYTWVPRTYVQTATPTSTSEPTTTPTTPGQESETPATSGEPTTSETTPTTTTPATTTTSVLPSPATTSAATTPTTTTPTTTAPRMPPLTHPTAPSATPTAQP